MGGAGTLWVLHAQSIGLSSLGWVRGLSARWGRAVGSVGVVGESRVRALSARGARGGWGVRASVRAVRAVWITSGVWARLWPGLMPGHRVGGVWVVGVSWWCSSLHLLVTGNG